MSYYFSFFPLEISKELFCYFTALELRKIIPLISELETRISFSSNKFARYFYRQKDLYVDQSYRFGFCSFSIKTNLLTGNDFKAHIKYSQKDFLEYKEIYYPDIITLSSVGKHPTHPEFEMSETLNFIFNPDLTVREINITLSGFGCGQGGFDSFQIVKGRNFSTISNQTDKVLKNLFFVDDFNPNENIFNYILDSVEKHPLLKEIFVTDRLFLFDSLPGANQCRKYSVRIKRE